MTYADFFTGLIALATVVYTIGTFLLWTSTRDTARLAKQQAELNDQRLKAQIYTEMVEAHRTLFLTILQNEELCKHLVPVGHREESIREFIGTWLINHASLLHLHWAKGSIDHELWAGIKDDMRDLFEWPVVAERWQEVSEYHTTPFREFIGREIMRESKQSV